jgi:hypothetical protein
VLILVEQALSAGVDEVVLIVNEHDQADYEQFFNDPLPPSVFHSLPPASQAYAQRLLDMGRQVRIVVQASLEVGSGFSSCTVDCRAVVIVLRAGFWTRGAASEGYRGKPPVPSHVGGPPVQVHDDHEKLHRPAAWRV